MDKKKKKKKQSLIFPFFLLHAIAFHFFHSYSSFSEKGTLKKIKDYFVADNHFFNQWIGGYSESRSWESTS